MAGEPDWQTRSAERQLADAKKILMVIEEQAAGHTTLTIPAELQVKLENQRARVQDLERRVAGKPGELRLKQAPDWMDERSLEEIMDYLSLYCDPALVEAVMKQVVLAPMYRRAFTWNLRLEVNRLPRRRAGEALIAHMDYSFEQIAAGHNKQEIVRSYAVYHVPSQLSAKGRLVRMAIETEGEPPLDLRDREVERFAERSAYGTFYRVPFSLRRSSAARVSAEVSVFHPARSEEILVSYYPCTDYTATVSLPVPDAGQFQLRVEFWHPSRSAEWMADDVVTKDGFETSTYRITEPLLPYQGLRVAWHYR